eukprot:9227133-Alexandrium_andersonii.AAC.1
MTALSLTDGFGERVVAAPQSAFCRERANVWMARRRGRVEGRPGAHLGRRSLPAPPSYFVGPL